MTVDSVPCFNLPGTVCLNGRRSLRKAVTSVSTKAGPQPMQVYRQRRDSFGTVRLQDYDFGGPSLTSINTEGQPSHEASRWAVLL